ncbi:MAG: hypothetical protein CMC96_14115 [Flavobacteriales bacterium]|nr:hypothetical protein [Flavobacteriales bacterium]|tara:strand:+ start:2594 stop:3097 length:504 start_codon:yes stop_codon:yes gene_type:complete
MTRDERIRKWMGMNFRCSNQKKWVLNNEKVYTSKILIYQGEPYVGDYFQELIGKPLEGGITHLKEIRPCRENHLQSYIQAFNDEKDYNVCPYLNDIPYKEIKYPESLLKEFSNQKLINPKKIIFEDDSEHIAIDLSNGGLYLKLFPELDRALMYSDKELENMGLYLS